MGSDNDRGDALSTLGLDDYPVTGLKLQIAGVEIIQFACGIELQFYYIGQYNLQKADTLNRRIGESAKRLQIFIRYQARFLVFRLTPSQPHKHGLQR